MPVSNLFQAIPASLPEELFAEILTGAGPFRIERIVSQGHHSPPDFWYDQPQAEWVILLQGAARLTFEGRDPIELQPGDYINIPAHTRHRVDWTSADVPAVWLAVHYAS